MSWHIQLYTYLYWYMPCTDFSRGAHSCSSPNHVPIYCTSLRECAWVLYYSSLICYSIIFISKYYFHDV